MDANQARAVELQRRIEELKERWPAHSVPPALMDELDELEAELERTLARLGRRDGEAKSGH